MNRNMFVLPTLPLLVAAVPSWQGQTLASAATSIEKANREWTQSIVTGNAAVLSAPYAKDAVFVSPDGTAIHGKAGVKTMYARRPKGTKVLHATIHTDGRVAIDPEDVYEWGSAQMTVQRKGKQRMVVGRYLTVWHRTGKQWLITRNIAF